MIEAITNFITNNILLSIGIYYGIVFIILCIWVYFDNDEYSDNTWSEIFFIYLFSPIVIPALLVVSIIAVPVFIKNIGEKHRKKVKERNAQNEKIIAITKKYKNNTQKLIDELSKL